MADLKYYRDERVEFAEAFGQSLSWNELVTCFGKLKAHYRFRQDLKIGGRKSCCGRFRVQIKKDQMNLAVLCHEAAHAIQLEKERDWGGQGHRWHTKKHKAIMKRILAFTLAHRAAWIEKEDAKLDRKADAFRAKCERQEQLKAFRKTQEFKIGRLKVREKMLILRIKRFSTSLKKVQKSLKRYEKLTLSASECAS